MAKTTNPKPTAKTYNPAAALTRIRAKLAAAKAKPAAPAK